MTQEGAGSRPDNGVTEDEAALYDRQIRLWGLEAQGRIRSAHILVINLDGLTTEAIKNWVLAGIHRLTLIDVRSHTTEDDLSAGFFWRPEDVGKPRLPSAAARVQALNPLVKIDLLPSTEIDEILRGTGRARLAELKPDVLVVGVPSGPQSLSSDWSIASLSALNRRARKLEIKFYCAGTQGTDGWIFSDLGDCHEFVVEKPSANVPLPASTVEGAQAGASAPPAAVKKMEKRRCTFVPLDRALSTTWKGLTRVQVRRSKQTLGYFGVLAAWKCAESDARTPPSAARLAEQARLQMQERGIDPRILASVDDEEAFYESLSIALALPGEFSPSCAILGGVLAQDVLNAIGGREETLINWFQLEGLTGSGPVIALSASPSSVVL